MSIPFMMVGMITVVKTGDYRLVETPAETKLLILEGKRIFAWVNAKGIGDILVTSRAVHKTGLLRASGKYRLYNVKDETFFTDLLHLELLIGRGKWQGYLLPTGLPDEKEKRKRIIPTDERITCAPASYSVLPYQSNSFSSVVTS